MHIEGSPREMDSGHNKSTEEGAEQFTPRQVYEDIVNGTDIAADERGRKLREKIRGGGSEATELKRAIIT